MKKNAGFTLIELVAVMVILAILAVVAVPQFVNLRAQARQAATAGVAGALASASALNFAQRAATNNTQGFAVTACGALPALLAGGMPVEGTVAYTIDTTTPIPTPGQGATCTVTHPDGTTTATFTAIGA